MAKKTSKSLKSLFPTLLGKNPLYRGLLFLFLAIGGLLLALSLVKEQQFLDIFAKKRSTECRRSECESNSDCMDKKNKGDVCKIDKKGCGVCVPTKPVRKHGGKQPSNNGWCEGDKYCYYYINEENNRIKECTDCSNYGKTCGSSVWDGGGGIGCRVRLSQPNPSNYPQ